MVECKHHFMEVLMNEVVRKELGEMLVCQILWLVWMKEYYMY